MQLLAAPLLALLFSQQAQAACVHPTVDSRLRAYCLSEMVFDRVVRRRDALVVDRLLKNEGWSVGVGLDEQVEPLSLAVKATPIVSYSSNINGGNPDRPLVLDGISFVGEEGKFRKKGLVLGGGVDLSGRLIYGEGSYLDGTVSLSYVRSPEHGMGISRSSIGLCSKNHIQDNWYLDGCIDFQKLRRDLKLDEQGRLQFSIAKLFSSSRSEHHRATIGLQRYYEAQSFQQRRIVAGWETVRSDGFNNSVTVMVGEPLGNVLALRHSATASLGVVIFDRALTAAFGYRYDDGGKLLGVDRSDSTYTISLTYEMFPAANISVGYVRTDSSIDYFNEGEVIFGFQFKSLPLLSSN